MSKEDLLFSVNPTGLLFGDVGDDVADEDEAADRGEISWCESSEG